VDVEGDHPPPDSLTSREPAVEDLLELCRALNACRAEYVVIGGFAMRALGYDRRTMDVDLLIRTTRDNEARVFRALESLPDKAVRELRAGDVDRYAVVRVADEIVVDLMKSAGGLSYDRARPEVEVRNVDGVAIPFASARLLWRTKAGTHRDKDAPDLLFLRHYFAARGEDVPG
jgi:hypothetical protein